MRKKETSSEHEVSAKEGQPQLQGTSKSGQAISLTVEHLQGMFIIFIVGSLASLSIFGVEMILAECMQRWM